MEKVKEILKNPSFWVLLFIITLGILAFIAVGLKNDETGFLLVSNISSFECNPDLECQNIANEEIIKKNNTLFDTYQKENYVGEYKVDYINKWNFYDKKSNWINLQDSFLAGSKNLALNIKVYEKREMSMQEQEELKKALSQNKITYYSTLAQNEVVEYDFNHDGNLDKIILASNATDESRDEKLFSIVIGIVKNKAEVLHIDIYNQYENYEVPIYNIKNIINLFNKKEDLLIINKGYFSEVGTPVSFIYKVDKKNFVLMSE